MSRRLICASLQQFEADPIRLPPETGIVIAKFKQAKQQSQAQAAVTGIPQLWDIDAYPVNDREQGSDAPDVDISWDLENFSQGMETVKTYELNAPLQNVPKGLWNRYRIWRLVEALLKEPLDCDSEATDGHS